jgi:hypothetical protein
VSVLRQGTPCLVFGCVVVCLVVLACAKHLAAMHLSGLRCLHSCCLLMSANLTIGS